MSLYTDLSRFLTANGVNQTTAQQASSKLQQKVRLNSYLSVEEVTLAHEFIGRGARPGVELSQLNSVLDKSVVRLPRTSMIGGKVNRQLLGTKVEYNLLGDKSARNFLGWKVKPNLSSHADLQPADIRQLVYHIVNT